MIKSFNVLGLSSAVDRTVKAPPAPASLAGAGSINVSAASIRSPIPPSASQSSRAVRKSPRRLTCVCAWMRTRRITNLCIQCVCTSSGLCLSLLVCVRTRAITDRTHAAAADQTSRSLIQSMMVEPITACSALSFSYRLYLVCFFDWVGNGSIVTWGRRCRWRLGTGRAPPAPGHSCHLSHCCQLLQQRFCFRLLPHSLLSVNPGVALLLHSRAGVTLANIQISQQSNRVNCSSY